MEQKRTCPECNLIFEAARPETGLLTCPLCDTVFAVGPSTGSATQSVAQVPQVASSVSPPIASGRHVLKGCLAVGALIFLAGGLVYAYHLIEGGERKTASVPPPPLVVPSEPPLVVLSPPEPPVVGEPLPILPAPPPLKPMVLAPKPPGRPAEVRVTSASPLPERINRAIDRGLAYLRKNHNGHDQYRNYLGLLGLTLLECGVAKDDPAVKQIAAWLQTREGDLTATYELALAILFFDRLGDPRDRTIIRTFGRRLLAGQLDGRTWTYNCPLKDGGRPAPDRSPLPLPRGLQPPQVISWGNGIPISNPASRRKPSYRGDNSNTQFAILGLWVAQRYGVTARPALLSTERYYRDTQRADGSWSYHPTVVHFRDSMTCAALMSLAMRYGANNGQGRDIRPEHPVQVSDPAITRGLRFLGRSINKVSPAGGRITGVEARDPLYFLWSLERMAVIYDLKTVGEQEWYPWAATMLVDTQQADGSWSAPYPSPVGTCFALLILKRSNVAHDLQLAVQGQPRSGLGLTGPTIIQGPNAALGPTTTREGPPRMPGIGIRDGSTSPLGPTTIQGPKTNSGGKKPDPLIGVLEIPKK